MSTRGLSLALVAALAGCRPADDLVDGVVALPASLDEVSGMVAIDADTVACVQDEVGAIFFVDLRGEQQFRAVAFGPDGDYEGVAWTGSGYWVLRSDGVLLEIGTRDEQCAILATHRLPKDAEYEGLCFDADNQRLLVLPKGPISGKKKERARRRVFAFDLRTKRVVEKPVLSLRLGELIEQAASRGLDVPTRTTKKGNERIDLKLRGSELLKVPGRDELLLLSARDQLLLLVDFDGRLLATRALDAERLPQPEAMTFLPDGRLLVASEGVEGAAVIVVVDNYR